MSDNTMFNSQPFASLETCEVESHVFDCAKKVADHPAGDSNPLFLYGAIGTGKTYLLRAMNQRVLARNSKARNVCFTAKQFSEEYIEAVRDNRIFKLRDKYRSCTLLMLDDVEFLAGQERMQEEFFHLFLHLIRAGVQIILACNCDATRSVPKEIATIQRKLVSRFEGGRTLDLTLDIHNQHSTNDQR